MMGVIYQAFATGYGSLLLHCCLEICEFQAHPEVNWQKIKSSFTQERYNCAVLILRNMYWLFMYISKYISHRSLL